MADMCENIYKTSRIHAGFTQEDAAYRLNLSVSALQKFERGERSPHEQIILRMIAEYDDPTLAMKYLTEENKVGQAVLNRVNFRDAPMSFLTLQKELSDVLEQYKRMTAILADGQISDDEKEDAERFKKNIEEAISACMAMAVRL